MTNNIVMIEKGASRMVLSKKIVSSIALIFSLGFILFSCEHGLCTRAYK